MISNTDIDTTLAANCPSKVSAPNGAGNMVDVCDPRGAFNLSDNTKSNFGKVVTMRGHRSVEYAVKFYF